MKLVTVRTGRDGVAGALLSDGSVLDLARAGARDSLQMWIPSSIKGILQAGPAGLGVVRDLVIRVEETPSLRQSLRELGALLAPDQATLMAPVPRPGLVVAAGLAYKSHLAEMSGTPPPRNPTAFMKSPNSISHPDTPLVLPPQASEHVDYEGELAVVFGSRCHAVNSAQALACVAGYTIANDVSARDWVRAVWDAKEPWPARQTWEVNIMGKQFDGFTPLGPVLLTADEVPDVGQLEIVTRLNGVQMQRAPVSDLIFSLAETISYLSRWYTFQPGDVLLTGTPAGVGAGRKPPVFMKAGDVVEVEVGPIGTLRNRVIAGPAAE